MDDIAALARVSKQTVYNHFGDKEKLVDRVLGVVALGEQDRDKLRAKLLAISNRKLIRMLEVSGQIRENTLPGITTS